MVDVSAGPASRLGKGLERVAQLSLSPGADRLERIAAAIGDATRRAILVTLLDAAPRSVDEVAAHLGVHRTVAFAHLERLTALGLLSKSWRRGRPGRPATLYRPAAALDLHLPPRQPALLAAALALALAAGGGNGPRVAADVARRLGGGLHPRRDRGGLVEALETLGALGAKYEERDGVLRARHCVFADVCPVAPEVVCRVHGGLIEGVLAAAGINVVAEPLPLAEGADACAFRLRPLADTTSCAGPARR